MQVAALDSHLAISGPNQPHIQLVPGFLCTQRSYTRHITRWLRDFILWIKNFDISVCMHTSTYNINRDTAMNFTQECFSITLSVASISLCSYSCPYLFLRLCVSVGVLILYCFVLMSLCGWWFIAETCRRIYVDDFLL
jgi:hypothetical protein